MLDWHLYHPHVECVVLVGKFSSSGYILTSKTCVWRLTLKWLKTPLSVQRVFSYQRYLIDKYFPIHFWQIANVSTDTEVCIFSTWLQRTSSSSCSELTCCCVWQMQIYSAFQNVHIYGQQLTLLVHIVHLINPSYWQKCSFWAYATVSY